MIHHTLSPAAALTLLLALGARPAARAQAATITDTTRPAAIGSRLHPSRRGETHVSFDFGAGPSSASDVRGMELTVTPPAAASSSPRAAGGHASGDTSAPAAQGRLKFLKAADSLTAELLRRATTGERVPLVTATVARGGAAADVTLRLADATVVSDRIIVADEGTALEQQRLSLEEAAAQLSADLREAQRQLALAEELDRSRLSSKEELVRARERVVLLQARAEVQRGREALLAREAAAGVVEEVVVAGRVEVP